MWKIRAHRQNKIRFSQFLSIEFDALSLQEFLWLMHAKISRQWRKQRGNLTGEMNHDDVQLDKSRIRSRCDPWFFIRFNGSFMHRETQRNVVSRSRRDSINHEFLYFLQSRWHKMLEKWNFLFFFFFFRNRQKFIYYKFMIEINFQHSNNRFIIFKSSYSEWIY